jgi:hypothetical protein
MALYYAGTTSTASADAPAATINGTRTILQLVTTSGVQATVVEWGISFDNANAGLAPIRVILQRQTTAGTSSSGTVQKVRPGIPAANTTVLRNFSSTDPTAGDIVGGPWNVNPAGGQVIQSPLGRELMLDVSTRLAIVTIGVTANISNASAYFLFEE